MNGEDESKQVGKTLKQVEPEDLIRFGLIPEFVGRLPVVATLDELDLDALIQILRIPKNSLVHQYEAIFKMEGVEIDFRDGAITAIARRAMNRKTGARGLRSIVEETLLNTMFELPSLQGVSRVVVDESVVKGEKEPMLVYQKEAQAS